MLVLPVRSSLSDRLLERGHPVRPDDVGGAAHRRAVPAPGRPGRHDVQVVGQGPRLDRLEHVVIEREVLRVGPVVGDLRGGVVAHHVRRAGHRAGRVIRDVAGGAGGVPLLDEAVHRAAVHVGHRVGLAVRPAAVTVGFVMVGAGAPALRVGHAHRGHPVPHRDAVGPRERAEVAVERPVLLHHDDHVLDLVDARRHQVSARSGRPRPGWTGWASAGPVRCWSRARCTRPAGRPGSGRPPRHATTRRRRASMSSVSLSAARNQTSGTERPYRRNTGPRRKNTRNRGHSVLTPSAPD